LPRGFQKFKQSPLVLALVVLVFAGLMIVAYSPKILGVKHAGWLLVGAGIFLELFALGLNEAVSNKFTSRISLSNTVLQSSLRQVIHDTAHNLSGTYMLIGGLYISLGAAGVGAYYYFLKKTPEAGLAPAAVTPKSKPAAPPKPAKKIAVK